MSETGLIAHLDEMFSGELPAIVSDSPSALRWAQSVGLKSLSLDELAGNRPDTAIVFICSDVWYQRLSSQDPYFEQAPVNSLDEYFTGSRVLWFPFATFDGSEQAVEYGLRLLEHTDFSVLPEAHRQVFELLGSTTSLGVSDARGTRLEVGIGGHEAEFVTISDLVVESGNDFLAPYFEVEFVWLDAGKPTFVPDGVVRPAGLLAAHTQAFRADDPAVRRAADLVRRVGRGAPPTIEISQGTVTRIDIGGTDCTAELAALAGETRGLMITEFAFGTNPLPADLLSWQVNSPLNEGVHGIHLAIGDGDSGIHFDFVCPGAAVS